MGPRLLQRKAAVDVTGLRWYREIVDDLDRWPQVLHFARRQHEIGLSRLDPQVERNGLTVGDRGHVGIRCRELVRSRPQLDPRVSLDAELRERLPVELHAERNVADIPAVGPADVEDGESR